MPETLIDLAFRHATQPGPQAIPRVSVHVARETRWPIPILYRPMVGLVLRGAKQVTIGDRTMRYEAGHYFIASIDVPAASAAVEASPQAPYVAARLAVDQQVLADVAVGMANDAGEPTVGFAVEAMTPDLVDAWFRMLRLLDAPDDISTLAPLVEREILFRILRGPQGKLLRQAARNDSRIAQVRRVIAHLRANFARPVRMEDLIEIAGMSEATFHRHFRAATAMSPLQYQKALRLQEARRRLSVGADATGAAFAVGYESASQFSREYARMFGLSPGRDAARLRANAGWLVDSADDR